MPASENETSVLLKKITNKDEKNHWDVFSGKEWIV